MKNSIKALAVLAIVGFSGNAFAQSSATAVGTANATVVSPIAITAVNALSFGNIVGGTAGTVVEAAGTNTYSNALISPNNTTTATNGGQNGTIQDATFNVTGQANFGYNITTPGTTTVSNGTNTLNVTLASATSGVLSGGGTGTVTVTGTLTTTVPDGTGSQAYTGTWSEAVAYN